MKRTTSLMQAAVVLNSLPSSHAAKVLARLEPRDIKSVMDAMTRLDNVSAKQVEQALGRLEQDSTRWNVGGIPKENQRLQAAQRKVEEALVTPPSLVERSIHEERPFEYLLDTIPLVRAHLLADEHPKHIAIVLSSFPPDIASETMASLEEGQRLSVLKRLCDMHEINEDEVAALSYALKLRFKKLLGARQSHSKGLGLAANLLSCSDASMRETLLAHVSQSDPELAAKLQRSVFGIERLLTLEDKEIRVLLKNVDTSCWAPALKNAPPALTSKILATMAAPAAELLSHEIAEIGHVQPAVEDRSRQTIIQVVLRLAREGKIELRKNGPRDRKSFPQTDYPGTAEAASLIN